MASRQTPQDGCRAECQWSSRKTAVGEKTQRCLFPSPQWGQAGTAEAQAPTLREFPSRKAHSREGGAFLRRIPKVPAPF